MYFEETRSAWVTKGASLSDKSARKEFGLTQDEIIEGMKESKLQYRINYMHGNPYYKLIRSEVEAFVNEKYGSDYLKKKKIENELAQVKKEIRVLKSQLVSLEQRKTELLETLNE